MFKIPNSPDTSYSDQAEPDSVDFAALGERATGVISGCLVTAQGTPALFVDVALGSVVVNGVAVSVGAGSLAVAGGGANPRFDLVVVDSTGTKSILSGTPSTNPAFPSAFEPKTHCLLAAIYVRQSVTQIVSTDIVDKRVTIAGTMRRTYATGTTDAINFTDTSTSKTFKVRSSGAIEWMSSILQRTADSAMEFATSLTLKAADTALPLLVLKARATTPELQKVLDVNPNGSSTSLASISGTGVLQAANFILSASLPEGVVTANKGALCVYTGFSTNNEALWIKGGADGTNTGWVAFRSYVANESALPTGTVFAWTGNPASPPAGTVVCTGASYSATDPTYSALYSVIGTTWGGTAGVNFNVPDLRGRVLIGAGGTVNLALGEVSGNASGKVTLSIANLPAHNHGVNDPGHWHPKPYFAWYWLPASEPGPFSPMNNGRRPSSSWPYMDSEKFGEFNYEATTGITTKNTGSGTQVTTLDPVSAINWLIKL